MATRLIIFFNLVSFFFVSFLFFLSQLRVFEFMIYELMIFVAFRFFVFSIVIVLFDMSIIALIVFSQNISKRSFVNVLRGLTNAHTIRLMPFTLIVKVIQ